MATYPDPCVLAPFEEFEVKQLVAAAAISSSVYLKLRWPKVPPALYGFAKNIESDLWPKKVRALSTYIISDRQKDLEGMILSIGV